MEFPNNLSTDLPCETMVDSSAFLLTPRPPPFVFRLAPPRSSPGLLRNYGVALP
ncbi:Hypothetical protein SMAX5B_003377 [Scophthalmus maximus]|uniref:Uncharacterized protein n=1 Tax=Scophthalmus maximus TaxID=52904 RepID=A0A2U9D0H7_SCOMX|nr:Hypothetical protein SMAX5B_003377 [Scophthalmus maximus]